MQARVAEVRAGGDSAALRAACTDLARWLASRDRDLDEAVRLAMTALSIGDDIELRRETAAWLESLGQSGRAAAALKPIASMSDVESQEASYVLVRTGVLKARAGEAAGAAAAFDAAMSIDASDALPAELLGALASWDAEAVPPSDAAQAYVDAARRRAARRRVRGGARGLVARVRARSGKRCGGEGLAGVARDATAAGRRRGGDARTSARHRRDRPGPGGGCS